MTNSDDDERQPHQADAASREPAIFLRRTAASRRSRDDESDGTPRAIFDRMRQTRGRQKRDPNTTTAGREEQYQTTNKPQEIGQRQATRHRHTRGGIETANDS